MQGRIPAFTRQTSMNAVFRADAGVRPYRCGIRHINMCGHVAAFRADAPIGQF